MDGKREELLSAQDLFVRFPTDEGPLEAVHDLSFEVYKGEVLAVVGESGSGKTMSWLAMVGLLPKGAFTGGEVFFRGRPIPYPGGAGSLRNGKIAMVFQDAQSALHPLKTVGDQIAEAIIVQHPGRHRRLVAEQVVELLDLVGVRDPRARAAQYPHELSGGMRQRVMIAMAIANRPSIVVADEPTSALDVITQAQILAVLERVRDNTGCALVLITHDLGIVAGVAHRVMVMYAGRPVEVGTVEQIFYGPKHPYTAGLLGSLPRLVGGRTHIGSRVAGQPPSPVHLPSGCAFHPRCPLAELPEPCASAVPQRRIVGDGGHVSACHLAELVPVRLAPAHREPRSGGNAYEWERDADP